MIVNELLAVVSDDIEQVFDVHYDDHEGRGWLYNLRDSEVIANFDGYTVLHFQSDIRYGLDRYLDTPIITLYVEGDC